MSELHLIRHGQCHYGPPAPDTLTELGALQARHLGRWLGDGGHRFDAVYSGPARRHRDTAHHMRESAGVPLPAPAVIAELDEYPGHGIFAAAAAAGGERSFERMVQRWRTGELAADGLESFAAFVARVRRGLGHVMAAEGRGRRIAVVTSAGPVSVALQLALGIDDETTVRLHWVVANASITELRYRPGEVTLTAFNAVPHLPRALFTLR